MLAGSPLWLLLLANWGLSGCWQEIRYEPSNLAEKKTEETEARAVPSAGTNRDERESAPQDPAEDIVGEPFPLPVTPTENAIDSEIEPTSPDLSAELSIATDDPGEFPEQSKPVYTEPEELLQDEPASNSPFDELPPPVTASASWRLSSEWSMAVALRAKRASAKHYGKHREIAQREAERLGIGLPESDAPEDETDLLEWGVNSLLSEAGPRLVNNLAAQHSANHAALGELAINSHALLLNYVPNSPQLEPVIAAINRAAKASRLPDAVWSELVELLQQQAAFPEVKSAIFKLHGAAAAHLESVAAE